MSLPIHVTAYSGYKANERPYEFFLDESVYEIAAVLDQWYDPSAMYFKVQSTEGNVYLLRYDDREDEWTLRSGFDGDALLARPNVELITVDATTIRHAEQLIEGCESCHADDVEIPFDWILDRVTGRLGSATDYMLTEHAGCPNCKHELTEKTLVETKE
jgi:hypothetical protein